GLEAQGGLRDDQHRGRDDRRWARSVRGRWAGGQRDGERVARRREVGVVARVGGLDLEGVWAVGEAVVGDATGGAARKGASVELAFEGRTDFAGVVGKGCRRAAAR